MCATADCASVSVFVSVCVDVCVCVYVYVYEIHTQSPNWNHMRKDAWLCVHILRTVNTHKCLCILWINIWQADLPSVKPTVLHNEPAPQRNVSAVTTPAPSAPCQHHRENILRSTAIKSGRYTFMHHPCNQWAKKTGWRVWTYLILHKVQSCGRWSNASNAFHRKTTRITLQSQCGTSTSVTIMASHNH